MKTNLFRILVMLIGLSLLWLLFSGLFKPLLLILGLLSCLLVVGLVSRTNILEEQSIPHQIYLDRWIVYNLWLAWEIIKANIVVIRHILDPKLPITPTVSRLPADLTDLGQVIYANSITLTPGTVSMYVESKHIEVHALTQEGMEDLQSNRMYHRIKRLERNQTTAE